MIDLREVSVRGRARTALGMEKGAKKPFAPGGERGLPPLAHSLRHQRKENTPVRKGADQG